MMTPIELRRQLHRHPELSFNEFATSETIGRALSEAGIEWQPIAGTGILARIEGEGKRRQAVVLRADIDALPIEEKSGVPWQSEVKGVMHACGHDLHAAILYGSLCKLKESHFEGTLFGLFQPGEECNPGGAQQVLAEDPWRDYDVRAVIGEHVEPDLTVGSFGVKAGKYMAANDELHLRIEGRGGHGALRDRIQDTVGACARLILQLLALNGPERILSIGKVEAAGATNIIPDQVTLAGTMRLYNETEREATKEEIRYVIARWEEEEAMRVHLEIRPGYPAVVNDPILARKAIRVWQEAGYRTEELTLRPTSEDFGWYTTRYPSLFYRLGVGSEAGRLHTATFNPNEEAIAWGIEGMVRLALECLRIEK